MEYIKIKARGPLRGSIFTSKGLAAGGCGDRSDDRI